MKILVLGASGQVGSEMSRAFACAKNPNDIDLKVVNADRQDLDLSDPSGIGRFLDNVAPRFVINAAAYTNVDRAESEKDLALAVNFQAVKEIANYCGKKNLPLVHISTDYVFSGDNHVPYSEVDSVGPHGVYGKSKLAGELAIRTSAPLHIILRTAWVYGVRGNNFVKTMLRLAKRKREISIVNDQIGSPTSARAIAATIASMVIQMMGAEADDERWGTYHFAGLPFVSWAEFAEEIFSQAMQLEVLSSAPTVKPITSKEYPTPVVRPASSRLDCSKCYASFGIHPDDWRLSLNECLKELKDFS